MSSILLSNPFPAPPPSALTADAPATTAPVAPVQSGGAASSSEDAASFSGSGTGTNRQANTVALFQARNPGNWVRPADATGSSVIGAQAQDRTGQGTPNELPLGPDLPAVAMPDPLPTSPFLKRNDFVA